MDQTKEVFSKIWQAILYVVTDNINKIKNTITNVLNSIKTFFVNLWNNICNFFKDIWNSIIRIVTDNINNTKNAISNGLNWIKEIWSNIWNSITSTISNIWKTITSKIKDGVSGAWSAITSVFGNIGNWFKDKFSQAWQAVKDVFSKGGQIFDGIKDGILNGLKSIVNGIINGINKVIAVPFNGLNSALSKIKNVDILGFKPFDWIKTIGVPQIPRLARGGIVNQPTQALIGEAGREAVLPLENNTEWMDILASKIAAILGSNFNSDSAREIILKFDGTLGQLIRLLKIELDNESRRRGDKLILGGNS